MDFHQTYLLFSVAILGLVFGSFINVVIQRYPKMLEQAWKKECESFLKHPKHSNVETENLNLCLPRSHCMQCKHGLKWSDLVPVLSYLWLKGHCRYCKAQISWQYPLVELLSAALLVLIAAQFGFTLYALGLMIMSEALLALAFIDLNTQLLPDDLTLSLVWSGLLLSLISPLTSPSMAILGAAAGYLFPWLIAKAYKLIRKREGMGYGDFKLFAAFGAWLGIQALPTLFLGAALLGLVFSLIGLSLKKMDLQQAFPFGPAIIIAGVILLFAHRFTMFVGV